MKLITTGLYAVDDTVKEKVRQSYGKDKESVKKDIEILREWIKQQPHFPQGVQDDTFIENCLVRCKFRVEVAKVKIEKYYTLRGMHADAFKSIEIVLPSKNTELIIGLPYLTDTLERIIVIKISHATQADLDTDVMKSLKYSACVSELAIRSEYCLGYRVVHDFGGFTFAHFKKYAAKFAVYGSMYQEAYFSRISGIEYINVPSFIEIVMQGCRTMMSPKIFKRITIHKDLASLHKNVNKAYLPKDYGGEKGSLAEYTELLDKEFSPNIANFEKILAEEVSTESLRVGDVKHNESFGINGTFKTLTLD